MLRVLLMAFLLRRLHARHPELFDSTLAAEAVNAQIRELSR